MTIRRKKKRSAQPAWLGRGIPGLGVSPVVPGLPRLLVHRPVGQKARSASAHPSSSHSLEWEEEHITTDRLQDALSGTSTVLDANRNYPAGRKQRTDPSGPVLPGTTHRVERVLRPPVRIAKYAVKIPKRRT
jgi:hypothetical protein